MKPAWHDGFDCPVAINGQPAIVGHIATRAQAERWQAKGYDIAKATDRYITFMAGWDAAADEATANALADVFYATETEQLRKADIWGDDPDFYRVLSASKHHEWA